MAEAWYVARIKTTLPWDAIGVNLGRQGFSSYVPVSKTSNYFAGKKTIIEQPIFPSYIFIMLDLETMRWRAVNSTIGISYLLPARAEIPLPVPTEFITELHNGKNRQMMIETTKRFLSNELVRIIAGPLANDTRRCEVISSGENSTRVRTELLGRDTIVTVPTAQLTLA